jgi:hypothetical protein
MSVRDLRKVAPMWVNVSHAMFDDKEAHKARAPVCGRAGWHGSGPGPQRQRWPQAQLRRLGELISVRSGSGGCRRGRLPECGDSST